MSEDGRGENAERNSNTEDDLYTMGDKEYVDTEDDSINDRCLEDDGADDEYSQQQESDVVESDYNAPHRSYKRPTVDIGEQEAYDEDDSGANNDTRHTDEDTHHQRTLYGQERGDDEYPAMENDVNVHQSYDDNDNEIYAGEAEKSGDAILGSMSSKQISNLESENDATPVALGGEDEITDLPTQLYSKSIKRVDDIEPPDIDGDDSIFQDIQTTLQLLISPTVPYNSTDAATSSQDGQKHIVARLKTEYDKLHRLFLSSRKNEQTLMKKCCELTADLTENASKVQEALKISHNDRSTITSLQKEVKAAWKMVESAGEKEIRAKDVAASLRGDADTFRMSSTEARMSPSTNTPLNASSTRNKLVELQMEQEDQLQRVIKEKQVLEQELTAASAEYRELKVENAVTNEKIESLTRERELMDEEMLTLKELLASKKVEQDRDTRSRTKTEQTLKQSTEAWEKREAELKLKVGETKSMHDLVLKLEMQLQNERIRLEKSEKDRDQLGARVMRLQQEYNDQSVSNQRLLNENHEMSRDLKTWEDELSMLKENFKMVSRVKDTLNKKLKSIDEAKMGAEMDRDSLRSTNSHLTHDMEGLNREFELAKKSLEMSSRERDIAQKNFVKATGAAQKQFNVLKLSEQTQRKLEQEIQGYKDEAQKMRKLIYTLEKDRDNKINESSRLDQLIMSKDEDMRMKDMMIFDSKKKTIDFERKLKEQQALYESVRADRNVYSKNLIESQDEITEMKRKLKIINHQVEKLKEEIASREGALVKEHFEHSRLEKEKEALSIQIGKLQQQYEESQQIIQNQQAEENKYRHIITEADMERVRQKKEYDGVVQERDILGTQLIRRNDELSLLYEKIKIQTSTLNKGEIQYRERLEDIRVLRLEIKRLRREKAILQTETQNVDSLRSEIFRLQRDVLRERTRVKVLEEELESPMNIHRWRKLAGSDPSTYELITKIQTLQKRLITKTEEVVEKELVIQQKEKLYTQVKLVLQRQPGPEVVEELRVVRDAVKTKIHECKALASELNMYHSQVNEYKYEIERLGRELQDLKKKVLPVAQASPGWAASAAESMLTHQQQPIRYVDEEYIDIDGEPKPHLSSRGVTSGKLSIKSHPSSGPRFSGGGFNMSTGVHHLTKPSADYRDNVDSKVCCDENAKKGTPDQLSYSKHPGSEPTDTNNTHELTNDFDSSRGSSRKQSLSQKKDSIDYAHGVHSSSQKVESITPGKIVGHIDVFEQTGQASNDFHQNAHNDPKYESNNETLEKNVHQSCANVDMRLPPLPNTTIAGSLLRDSNDTKPLAYSAETSLISQEKNSESTE
ncbi:hypothetical protein BASA62_002432 [Batrachochytrium salamandrivorans]|nr:hypothetical protein BASA62_002432 [Batrachochytrium salamandrivorans]